MKLTKKFDCFHVSSSGTADGIPDHVRGSIYYSLEQYILNYTIIYNERGVQGSSLELVRSDTLLSTARHCNETSSKRVVYAAGAIQLV